MSLLRPHVVLLSLATLLGAHGCARPLPRGVQAADDVPTTRHVRRERTRSVAAQGFVQRFDGGFVVGLWVHNDTYAPVIVARDTGLHHLVAHDTEGEAFTVLDPGDREPELGRWTHTSLDARLESLDGVLLTPGDEVRLVTWLDDHPRYARLGATFELRVFAPDERVVEERRLVSLDAVLSKLAHPAPAVPSARETRPAPLVDDGRVYELGPWGYAVGVGVTNLGGAPVIVGGDWLVNSVAFPGGPSAWTGRRCGWTCALRPAVVPDVCSWRRGVLLGSGETVALFLDQRFEPEGTFRGVSVSYEVDTTSVPCTGGAWLRGDFLADTEPLL